MADTGKSPATLFSDPSYLAGPEPEKSESVDQRSWGQAAADFGLAMADTAVNAGRDFLTTPARYAEDTPGTWTDLDDKLRSASHYIEQHMSARGRAAKNASLLPDEGQINAADMPGAAIGYHAAALVPWLIAGTAATLAGIGSGGTLPAAGAAFWAAGGAGGYVKSVYDMVDAIPSDQFQALPQAKPFLEAANGDERIARKKLAESSITAGRAALAAGGGALGGGVIGHAVMPKGGAGIIKRTLGGAAEGYGGMLAQNLTQEGARQASAIDVGVQQDYDTKKFAQGAADAVLPAVPIAGMHAMRRSPKVEAPPDGVDPAQKEALSGQLGTQTEQAQQQTAIDTGVQAPVAPPVGGAPVPPNAQMLGAAGMAQQRRNQARAEAEADARRRAAVADQIKIRNPMWDEQLTQQSELAGNGTVEQAPSGKGKRKVKQVVEGKKEASADPAVVEQAGDAPLETPVATEGAPVTPEVTGVAPLSIDPLMRTRADEGPEAPRKKVGDELDGFVAYEDQPVTQERVRLPTGDRGDSPQVTALMQELSEAQARVRELHAAGDRSGALQWARVARDTRRELEAIKSDTDQFSTGQKPGMATDLGGVTIKRGDYEEVIPKSPPVYVPDNKTGVVQANKTEVQYRSPTPSETTQANKVEGERLKKQALINALAGQHPRTEAGRRMAPKQARSHKISEMWRTGRLEVGLPVRSPTSDFSKPLHQEFADTVKRYMDTLRGNRRETPTPRDYRLQEMGEDILQSGLDRGRLGELAAKPGAASKQAEATESRRAKQREEREQIAQSAHGDAWQHVLKSPKKIKDLIRDIYQLSMNDLPGAHLTDRAERSTAVGTARYTTQVGPQSRKNRTKAAHVSHAEELTKSGNMVARIAERQINLYNKGVEKAQRKWNEEKGRKGYKFDPNHEVLGSVSSSRSGGADAPWYSHISRQHFFAREWNKLIAEGDGKIRPQDEGKARGLLRFYVENEISGAEGAHNFRKAESQALSERKTQKAIDRVTAGPKETTKVKEDENAWDRFLRGDDEVLENAPETEKKTVKGEKSEFADEEGRVALEEAKDVATPEKLDKSGGETDEEYDARKRAYYDRLVKEGVEKIEAALAARDLPRETGEGDGPKLSRKALKPDVDTLASLYDARKRSYAERSRELRQEYLGKLDALDPFHVRQRESEADYRLHQEILKEMEREWLADKDTTKPLIEARAKEQIPEALKGIADYMKQFTGGSLKTSQAMRKKFKGLPKELSKVDRKSFADDLNEIAKDVASGKRTVREGMEHLLEAVDAVPHNEATTKLLDKVWEAVAPWVERKAERPKAELMEEAKARAAEPPKKAPVVEPGEIARANEEAAAKRAAEEAARIAQEKADRAKYRGTADYTPTITDEMSREAAQRQAAGFAKKAEDEARAASHKAAVDALLTPKTDLAKHGMHTTTVDAVLDTVLPHGNALHKYFNSVARRLTSGVTVIRPSDAVFEAAVRRRQPDMAESAVKEALAYYDWKTDRIVVRDTVRGETVTLNRDKGTPWRKVIGGNERLEHALRHEIAHAITEGALRRYKFLGDRLDRIRQYAIKELGLDAEALKLPDNYGFRSKEEFLAEMWSNPEFAEMLKGIQLPRNWDTARSKYRLASVLGEAYDTIRRALYNAFGHRPARTVLERGLLESAEIFRVIEKRGREPYRAGRDGPRPDLRFLLGDSLKEAGVKALHEVTSAVKATHAPMALWAHSFHDLSKRGENEFQRLTGQFKDVVSRWNQAAIEIGRKRGDKELLEKIARITSLPDATVRQIADFVYAESHLKLYADQALPTKAEREALAESNKLLPAEQRVKLPNGHYDEEGTMWAGAAERHAKLAEEYQQLKKIKGFEETRKAMHEWGEKVQEQQRRARASHIVGMLDIVQDADGKRDPLAVSALTKHALRDKLTDAEKAWIDARRPEGDNTADIKREQFDNLVRKIRSAEEFKKIAGPYVPHMRRGDHVLSGRYILPEAKGGEKILNKNGDETGRVVFKTAKEAQAYTAKVAKEMGLTPIGVGRTVYDKATGEVARRWTDGDETILGAPEGEPGYLKVTRGHMKRMTIEDASQDPNLEVRHWVSFGNKHFEAFDGRRAADARYAKLHESGIVSDGTKPGLKLSHVEPIDRGDPKKVSLAHMSDELADLVGRAMKSETFRKMTDAEQSAWTSLLNQESARTIQGMGGRSPLLPREYAKGESHDLLQNYIEATQSTARNIAHAEHANELHDKSQEIKKWMQARRYSTGTLDPVANNGHTLRDAVWKEMQARAYSNPRGYTSRVIEGVVGRVIQMTYLSKLVGTSFLGINMMEPAIIGGPLLAGKYGPQAITTMAKAYSIIGGGRVLRAGLSDFAESFKSGDTSFLNLKNVIAKNIANSKLLNAREKRELTEMLDGLVERGLMDVESVNEVTLLKSSKTSRAGHMLDRIDASFRGLNGAVETMNRAVLAAAAYMEERSTKRSSVADARTAAYDMVYEGAGNYAAWNAPPVMNNTWLRPMMQFKKYPQRIAANYIRAAVNSFGKGPEAAEARKRLMYMFAMQSAVSGLLGLPTEPLTATINAAYIAGISPINSEDAEAHLIKGLADWVGPEAADYIAHGPLRMSGAALDTRLGHNNLVFFGAPSSAKPKDWLLGAAHILGGAPLGTMTNILGGGQDILQGVQDYAAGAHGQAYERFGQGARKMAIIRQVGDIYDAITRSNPGLYQQTPTGKAIGTELTTGEAIIKGLGFTPVREARRSDARRVEQRAINQFNAERSAAVAQWVHAEPQEKAAVWRHIQETFNKGRPYNEQIKGQDLAKAMSTYIRNRRADPSTLGLPTSKRTENIRAEYNQAFGIE